VPGDKSLSRLLGEAPVVPLATLKLVEELCNSSSGSETSKGEYVTAGLTALWSLILQRPPTRDTCLKMALKVRLAPSGVPSVLQCTSCCYNLHLSTLKLKCVDFNLHLQTADHLCRCMCAVYSSSVR
jgi:hypothetical protein